jgi:hypothetical protein
MSNFISSSPFQNTKRFLQIRSLAPGIARRSSGRFQLRRQLRRAITLNPCIVCRIQGYHCVRLIEGFVAARSVRRLDARIYSNRRIWLRLRRVSSSPVSLLPSSMDFNPSSSFLLSSLRSPSLSPHQPPAARPPTPVRVPALPLPVARHRQPVVAADGLGAVARGGDSAAPCRRGPAARPQPPRRRPSSSFPCAAQAPSPWPWNSNVRKER